MVTSQGRVLQEVYIPSLCISFASPNYYEPVEDWEVEDNTNINMLEETKENYLQSSKYAKAQMNVLDEVPQSYSHQGNPKLDQTKHTTET